MMKTLVFLGATVGYWVEANESLVAAESLWKIERRWHPEGKNETLDTFMVEIREALDGLSQELAEEQPSHFGVENGSLYIVDEEDAMIEDEDAMLDIVLSMRRMKRSPIQVRCWTILTLMKIPRLCKIQIESQ